MSSIDLHRFHADLTAAILAGAPIAFQNTSQSLAIRAGSRARILADLKRWETELSVRLTNAATDLDTTHYQQIETAFAHSSADYSPRYRAALTTFAVTNSMLPVLNGLTVPTIAQRQVSRSLRWPFIYLAIVLFVALLGLLLFSMELNPRLVALRNDLELSAAINAPARFDVTPWLSTVLIGLGTGSTMIMIAMLCGGFPRIVMAMGGRSYVQSRVIATAIKNMQALIENGVPREDAVGINCDLMSADLKTRNDLNTATAQVTGREHWTALEKYRTTSAVQRLNYLKVTVPMAIIAIVGGTTGLLYALAIYGPIIALIKDLSTAGT